MVVVYQKVKNLESSLAMCYNENRRNRCKSLHFTIKCFKNFVKISSQIVYHLINTFKINKTTFWFSMPSWIHSIKVITHFCKHFSNMSIPRYVIRILMNKKDDSFIIGILSFENTRPFVILYMNLRIIIDFTKLWCFHFIINRIYYWKLILFEIYQS